MIGYFDILQGRFRVVMNDDGTWSCEDETALRTLNSLFGADTGDNTHSPFGVSRLSKAARFFRTKPVVLVSPLPPLPPGFHY